MAADFSSSSAVAVAVAAVSSTSWKYDVFLSFRGQDTRMNFVGQLYNALERRAFAVFIDSEQLGKGDVLSVLLKAIDVSKLSVVVLSENYAFSKWCLIELARIIECMETKNQIVVPIFYQVDPFDVRRVRGRFQEAFEEHEHKSRGTAEDRKRWRSALAIVGSLVGWESLRYEDDTTLIEHIAQDISKKLVSADSSPFSGHWKYDVFLSFRGPDTRKIFVGHLYKALQQKSLNVFIDSEELGKGYKISELFTAIGSSRLSIVILSQNYASSSWCLKELAKIMECKDTKNQIVVPIFYQVNPANVRHEKGRFKKAFEKHETRVPIADVQSWKNALNLVTQLSGWDSRTYKDDAELITEIADYVFKTLITTSSSKSNDLVGMDFHVHQVKSLLGKTCPGLDGVGVVGISGMGGIGKTTIARAVYDEMGSEFEHLVFLDNVKEGFKKKGEVQMQEELLFRILKEKVHNLGTMNIHSDMIKGMLSKRKIFLVLDDVENAGQIDALLGNQYSFGPGSRIIITTRDKGLLRGFYSYEPRFLEYDEAVELFNRYAFKGHKPSTEYDDVIKRALEYAQGLPLALKVLGGFLYKKSLCEWEVEFEKLKKCPHSTIEDKLRTSFDGLDHLQKKIFLDVACFFRGMKKEYATEILDACGFFPESGLRVLADRALVTSTGYYNVLAMHDLLLDMALGILRQQSSLSRLSNFDDVEEVLTRNTDTKAIESIDLDLYHYKDIWINAKAFVRMTKLRLLRIRYGRSIDFVDDYYGSRGELYHLIDDCKQQVSGEFKFLSNELRCLLWHGCPLRSLPSNFQPKHLVDLDMRSSRIRQLWKGTKLLKKLKYIDLSLSLYLTETPDLTEAINLEKINLEGCILLVEVHRSISNLQKLNSMRLKGCKALKILPSSLHMKSLTIFELSGCSNLEIFPEISEVMEELPRLCLDKTAIKELPSSITNLKGLVTLSLKYCTELRSLPSSICRLKSLRYVILSGCSKFEMFPEILGLKDMQGLLELHLDGTSIQEFSPSFSSLKKLTFLSLRDCKELKSLPSCIDMESLKMLDLAGCSNLQKLPEISGNMWSLLELNIDETAIGELPASFKILHKLKSLSLKDCGILESLPSSIFQLACLTTITVSGSKFEVFPEIELDQTSKNLVTLRLEDCGELRSLSSSICRLKSLRYVALSGCSKLEKFPEIEDDMEELRELHLDGTSIKMLSPSIEHLKNLMFVNMRNCSQLISLPDNMCNLSYLTGLTLSGCSNLKTLPENMGNLVSLMDLEVEGSGVQQDPIFLNKLSSSTNFLVGMDRHIKAILQLCADKVDDVCFVNLCGNGGVGKTTIARAVYDQNAHLFEHHCFLENVREGFTKHGAERMQEKFLLRIFKENVQDLGISDRGTNTLIEMLGTKKVLLVLDDVDNTTQIETLLGKQHSFGGGSKIIITSREEELSIGIDSLKIYHPQLSDGEALQLFKHFAFRTLQPLREQDDLSQCAIQYAKGQPLDLKVWGGYLYNKSMHKWKNALQYERTLYWVYAASFNDLHYSERDILLDVAWFFKGMNKQYATKILFSSGFFPYSALRVLIDRSLIAVSDREETLEVNDLLHGIIRDFVRQADEHEPGNRSRLEGYQGIRCLSSQDQVTKAVEVITLDLSNSKEVFLSAEAFVTMGNLRLLQIYDNGSIYCTQHVIGDLDFLSAELGCLIWHRYPLKTFPFMFQPKNLVDLDMRFSHLEQLWEGTKPLKNLAFINLSYSQYLKKIPDLSEATNLEKLILDGCTSLLEVHPSIWNHEKVIVLSLKGCSELKILPTSIHMKSLKTLELSGCSSVEKFPDISEVMKELSELVLDETAIKELPASVECLEGLTVLSMRNCTSLVSITDSICSLNHLTFLNLSGCSKLSYFPDCLRNKQSLTISGIEQLPLLMRSNETEREEVSRVPESHSDSEDDTDRTEVEQCLSRGGVFGTLCSCLSCLLSR